MTDPTPAAPKKPAFSKGGLILAVVALILAVTAVVAGRVTLGSFVPGIVFVAVVAVIVMAVTIRSQRSALRKTVAIVTTALVAAAAIPASLKAAYPAYDHFFGKTTDSSSSARSGQASSTAPTTHGAGPSGTSTPIPQQSTTTHAGAPSGIIVMSGDGWDTADFGSIDTTTGKYTPISGFKTKEPAGDVDILQLSPDLTKFATERSVTKPGDSPMNGSSHVGWIDTQGSFTDVTPAAPAATDFPQSTAPMYRAPVFDGAGNFYYWGVTGNGAANTHLYKLAAGTTSNPQEITPTPKSQPMPQRNPDGTLQFGCANRELKWLGPDSFVTVTTKIGLPGSSGSSSSGNGFAIVKVPVIKDPDGCAAPDNTNAHAVMLVDLGIRNAHNPVPNPDGTKLAFLTDSTSGPDATPGGIFVVGTDGTSKPTRIANLAELKLPNPRVVRWY